MNSDKTILDSIIKKYTVDFTMKEIQRRKTKQKLRGGKMRSARPSLLSFIEIELFETYIFEYCNIVMHSESNKKILINS